MSALGGGVGRAWIGLAAAARGIAQGGSTPARLRVWMDATAIVAVLVGVLSATGVDDRVASMKAADASTHSRYRPPLSKSPSRRPLPTRGRLT